jgi:peptidoglycan/xylan/chitin deacetylase (PgdA/CDA1 family)
MPITLMYHDVVRSDRADSSGFPGGDAARYKLDPAEFRRHVEAIARAAPTAPGLATDLLGSPAPAAWLLTFDDGGASAYSPTADILDECRWRGHFFVTADFVNSPAFVTAEQVRDLHRRGHVIGSHSCSHPPRMSACGWERLVTEWQRSRDVLSGIIGEPLLTASVPGGFYSRAVARAAAQAGYKVLFTSEPTARTHTIDGCLVLGRYTINRGTSPERAAALGVGRIAPRLQQAMTWQVKKLAKRVGGQLYLSLRKRLLTGRASSTADGPLQEESVRPEVVSASRDTDSEKS